MLKRAGKKNAAVGEPYRGNPEVTLEFLSRF